MTSQRLCIKILLEKMMTAMSADSYVCVCASCFAGGRGRYRTPWGSPSASTCSRPSDCLHSRCTNTVMIHPHQIDWRRLVSGKPWTNVVLSPSAGVHFTAVIPVCLRRVLCICYSLVYKGMSLTCPLRLVDRLCNSVSDSCSSLHRVGKV